jgi:dTDP-glucose 4,6-dehydratase
VLHGATAASADLNERAPKTMLDTIVAGTGRVLELAARVGAPRVSLVSSGGVYGPQPTTIAHVDEGWRGAPDPLDPGAAYGEGKRTSELLGAIHARASGANVTIARCFAFVGPLLPLDAHFAIGNFLRDALAGGPIRVGGDGTPLRSYLYASDLAAWLWTILLHGASLRPYHVGSDDSVSIAELARFVAEEVGPPGEPIPVEIARAPVPGALPARYVPSVERARTELGLVRRVELRDAIRRTAAWHRGRPLRP